MGSFDILSQEQVQHRAEIFLASLPDDVRRDVEGKIQELKWHEALGLLSPQMYFGKKVLDWEAGLGGFSAAFYCLGAAQIVAIDSWVDPSIVCKKFVDLEQMTFMKTSAADFSSNHNSLAQDFDLIFSNTVTEHITDLPGAMSCLHGMLKDNGFYLNVHDNYYSPCGSHDHGFWFYGADNAIEFQGVACWASQDKCAVSAGHREKLLTQMPWTWNDRLEAKRNPENCDSCPYYRRSQPWANLTYVDEFVETFDDPSFLTWKPGSSLNKITTFQLRQILVEAGFNVMGFHRNRCTNVPPAHLLDAGLSPLELTTTTSVWKCSKS